MLKNTGLLIITILLFLLTGCASSSVGTFSPADVPSHENPPTYACEAHAYDAPCPEDYSVSFSTGPLRYEVLDELLADVGMAKFSEFAIEGTAMANISPGCVTNL